MSYGCRSGFTRSSATLATYVADDFRQRAQFRQFVRVDARDRGVLLGEGAENFYSFDGVDAEVGFHVHRQVQHLGRVARLFTDYGQQFGGQLGQIHTRCRCCWSRCSWYRRGYGHWCRCRCSLSYGCRGGFSSRSATLATYVADDFGQRAQFRQFVRVDARDRGILLREGTENFYSFDGVNAEVGFHVHG